MAIWNRKKETTPLQESYKERQLDLNQLSNLPYFQFASQMTLLRGQEKMGMHENVKGAMLKDPIISAIIDMWISDALTKDVLTGKVFDVDITSTEEVSKESEKEVQNNIQEIIENIDYLTENSNLMETLERALYEVITTGRISVKLGFVDMFEDTKIKLFETHKNAYNKSNILKEMEEKKSLLEAPDFDDYEKMTMNFKNKTINRINGRYYFEVLPNNIVPLKHKGITVLYLDLTNNTKVLNPKNITTFINTRGNTKKLSLKENPDDITSSLYEIPLGRSFIENAVTPWSMLNTTQDCTILALMTRSSIYRIFQVDVGALSNNDTEVLIQDFKKRITSRETIDVRSQHYSSAQTQIPLGDSIFIPTRNGLGNVNIQAVGGDLDIKTQVPLDYFREDLLASLGIAKSLMYGDESGTLINTSATRQDIRYLRKVQQFTAILSTGLEAIFKDYLKIIGVDLSKLSLKVRFAQLNSEDALNRLDYEQSKQDALEKTISSLKSLGISFEDNKYKNTRDELITRFLDSDLLSFIQEDENSQKEEIIEEPIEEPSENFGGSAGGAERSNPKGPAFDNTDSSSFDDLDSDEIPTPGEVDTDTVEPIEPDTTNEEPPFSIG